MHETRQIIFLKIIYPFFFKKNVIFKNRVFKYMLMSCTAKTYVLSHMVTKKSIGVSLLHIFLNKKKSLTNKKTKKRVFDWL